eukprot:scaffold4240_cov120-Isochrysis_galbana.AAC.5
MLARAVRTSLTETSVASAEPDIVCAGGAAAVEVSEPVIGARVEDVMAPLGGHSHIMHVSLKHAKHLGDTAAQPGEVHHTIGRLVYHQAHLGANVELIGE